MAAQGGQGVDFAAEAVTASPELADEQKKGDHPAVSVEHLPKALGAQRAGITRKTLHRVKQGPNCDVGIYARVLQALRLENDLAAIPAAASKPSEDLP